MALKITPGQPLSPLDENCCIQDNYCHLVDITDGIKLQGTQTPCGCLSCTDFIFGENQVPNPEFENDGEFWNFDGWVIGGNRACIIDGRGEERLCTTLIDYLPGWYKVVFDLEITAGCVRVIVGGAVSQDFTETGHYEILILGGSIDDQLCFETCGEVDITSCIEFAYAYPNTCPIETGENWTAGAVTETVTTPNPGLINGEFIGSHAWNAGYKWALGGGEATISVIAGTAGNILSQGINISADNMYDLELEVTDYSTGQLLVYLGGNLIDTISANGVYTYQVHLEQITSNKIELVGINTASFKISYVTIEGVAEWTRVLYYNICHIEGSTDPVTYTGILPLDTYLQLELTVQGSTAGSLTITAGSESDTITGNGTFILFLNSGSSQDLAITPSGDFDGCYSKLSVCTLVNDYKVVVKKTDGTPVAVVSSEVTYYKEYVTLDIDVNDICLWKTCFPDFDNTVLSSINIGGIPTDFSPAIDIDDIEAVQEALDDLNEGVFTYSKIGGEYCITSDNKNVESVTITIVDADDTYDFACERISLDGCHQICIYDPCPEDLLFQNLILESDFSSQGAANTQGWVGGGGVVSGAWCFQNDAGGFGIDLSSIYQDNDHYKITFTVAFTGTTNETTFEFFTDGGLNRFTITKDGNYEFIVFANENYPILFFLANGDEFATTCISNIKLYQNTPVEICTPCFTVGNFTKTCHVEETDEGEEEVCIDDCRTKLIVGQDKGEQFGFYFDGGFLLQQRIVLSKFNSFFPEDKTDYSYSDGNRKSIYSESEEYFILRTAPLPHNAHSTLRLQRSLDKFYIDGVLYFAREGEYRPEGEIEMALREVQFNVRKQLGTKYKRQ